MKKWLMLGLLVLFWGPSFMFIKIALDDVPPLTLPTIRISIAALFLYITLRIGGEKLPRGWEVWKKFLIMGFFSTALPFALFSIGEQSSPSSLAAIINGSVPLFTVIFAHFAIEDEPLSTRKVVGILTGFGGIIVIFLPSLKSTAFSSSNLPGLLAFTVASTCYAIGYTYARHSLRGFPRFVAPTAQMIGALVFLLPAAIIVEHSQWVVPGTGSIFSLLFLGIIGTAIALIVNYRLLEIASATLLSLVTYFLPLAGIILGVLFLDESLSWYALAGCACILLGIVTLNNPLPRLKLFLQRRRA